MKKSLLTEAEMMTVLRQAEGGITSPELCREHDVSNGSFRKWQKDMGAWMPQ